MQKLQVPDNISLRTEVIRGVSPKAMAVSLGAGGLTAARALGLRVFFPSQINPVTGTVAVLLVISLFRGFRARRETGQSIYDYLRCIRGLRRGQKNYYYSRKEVLYRAEETEDT